MAHALSQVLSDSKSPAIGLAPCASGDARQAWVEAAAGEKGTMGVAAASVPDQAIRKQQCDVLSMFIQG